MKLEADTVDGNLKLTIQAESGGESCALAFLGNLLNTRGTIGLDEVGSYAEFSCPTKLSTMRSRARTPIEILIDDACAAAKRDTK